MPRGHEKFVAIADVQGWGYANCDIRGNPIPIMAVSTSLVDFGCFTLRGIKIE
ncbi:hypothetical protein CsatB_000336 [Cannabis sativa]